MAYYLITGGCGLIGAHLAVYLLEDGHFVRVLDNVSMGNMETLNKPIT
jgi:UDP-glucose 4-epimerase